MGLYSLACAALNKSEPEYLDVLFTDFHRTAEESRLGNFALFFAVNDEFKIILNKGFNAETVRKSSSTHDFWSGTLPDNQWNFIKGESLNPFYQLFSSHDAAFDCLSIKKSVQGKYPFIFAAAGEFSEAFLQKQLNSLLPFITRTYTVLSIFYKPVSLIPRANPAFLEQAKARFALQSASLYKVKLNKLFESLFALLGPSDFDFITSCIGAAAASPNTDEVLCSVVDEESTLYILTDDKRDSDFSDNMNSTFEKMFSQKKAALLRTERASEESPLYKQLSQEITLTKSS